MEIEHCFPWLPDGVESGLQNLADLKEHQEEAGQIVQAAYTESRMRCFLYLWMPPERTLYGVFS